MAIKAFKYYLGRVQLNIGKHSEREQTQWQEITKAELLQEGIFFLLQLFARDVLVMKKLEIEETKTT